MIDIYIPNEIYNHSRTDNDVHIIIGENGSGKSTILAKIAYEMCFNHNTVFAIANTVFDKFKYSNGLHLLRARNGRTQIKLNIKQAFSQIDNENFSRLRNIINALDYVGYNPRIGFQVRNLDVEKLHELINSEVLNPDESQLIESILTKIYNEQIRTEIIWIEIGKWDFYELEKASFTQIFKFEKLLVKAKVIKPIEIYLSKKNLNIPLLSASSGELSLISTIIYISINIQERAAILVDEPENSLHPNWQKDYVSKLLDIFYRYQPKIIVATHSPIILSESAVSIKGLIVYRSDNFTLKKQHEIENIEEILFSMFDIITPQNRFLSDLIIKKLNQLSQKTISIESFNDTLSKMRKTSFDKRQIRLIDEVSKISKEIIAQ